MARAVYRQTWWDRCLGLRDRLLINPTFQRLAAGFGPTQPLVRRRARALFDLCAGFVYSQVLLACVRLRLVELLAGGPLPAGELERRLGLGPDATLRLLRAAVALRLLERRRGERFGLGPLGAALLGNPGIAALVEHHVLLYADLGDPVALLRQRANSDTASATRLGRYWPYAEADQPARLAADQVAAYSELMAASQPLVAAEILAAYRFQRHHCLLDVGGGEGRFLAAVAERAPRLKLMLFDLPAVAERAKLRLAGRATVYGGSMFSDPLPQGADLISLVRVVHDHDDHHALTLLRAVHRVLTPGGRVLLAEPMADTKGAEPAGDAYFGFYLLAMGSGKARTPTELKQLLTAAGFGKPKLLPTRTPLLIRVMVAERSDVT